MKKPSEKPLSDVADSMERWFGIIIVLLVIISFFWAVKSFFFNTTDYLDKKDSQKARCQTHWTVIDATTEFAAKKAYEKCMDK